MNLWAYLPQSKNASITCFTFVRYKVDEAPDIVTCNSSGYMYEIKNKIITRCLNLHDIASSVSCYYLSENDKVIIFYLVLTSGKTLLVIRRTNKHLKVVKTFETVKDFEVYDFECLGFPQIKISFTGEWGSVFYKFPVESYVSRECNENVSTMSESLAEELQLLNGHNDDLTGEYDDLRKLCDSSVDYGMCLVGSLKFSSTLKETDQQKLMVREKWCKVFGLNLILGMRLLNISSEILNDMELIISNKKIKNYSYSFFRSFNDIDSYLLSSKKVYGTFIPGENVCAIGVFRVLPLFSESQLFLSFHVTSSVLKDCLVKDVFEVNIWDIASKTSAGLEGTFTVEDLMAVMTVKTEARVRIQTEDLLEGFMESIVMKNLGFTRIKHLKDKLFYCTSTYLNEVFVTLQYIAANPAFWRMLIYTSDSSQIYFLINALYALLPENTEISCKTIQDRELTLEVHHLAAGLAAKKAKLRSTGKKFLGSH